MTLRLPDNLMARPMLPGVLGDGTENVTRQFGNRSEQISAAPNIPNGFGGAVNPAAGVENQAAAKAAETVAQSVVKTVDYMDNLRTAEEDSRAKRMMLEIDKRDAEIRAKLDADPEYGKKSTTDQQAMYETERDAAIDEINQSYGFNQPKVVKMVQDNLAMYKAKSSEHYLEKVVKPRVIVQSKINDQASDNMVIDKVTVEPTQENVLQAVQNIRERYDSPQAYATYGAQGAMMMKIDAMKKLQATMLTSFSDKLETGPLASLDKAIGRITIEDAKDGPVSAIIADEKGKFKVLVDSLDITEQEKLVLLNKGEKYIDKFAGEAIKSHNAKIKEEAKLLGEQQKEALDSWSVALLLGVRDGSVDEKRALSEFRKLMDDPRIKDDPSAQRKAIAAYEKVTNELTQERRHREKLASDKQTRDSITQQRLDNGIDVTGSALDALWQKNGMIKRFYAGNNIVTPEFVSEIDKAGAVPTSITLAIQADLRSQDPNAQQRGVANLLAIKTFSAKSQQALYKELPDNWAGVLHRIENGQSIPEALSFLNRPRPTPDIEKKLHKDADNKQNKAYADESLKAAKFDPSNMSTPMREEAQDMWRDAFARANGDVKLAQSLFQQDLAKNRTWGTSEFSGKVEKYPVTNFAPKKTIEEIVNTNYPETKGKDILPVFGGLLTVDGKVVPTYDIYTKDENGLLVKVNKRPYHFTKEEIGTIAQREEEKKLSNQVDANEEVKANMRYWENKKPDPKMVAPKYRTKPTTTEGQQ